MLERLKRRLPSRETLQNNRALRWLGPWIQHPRLWHMSRKGIALGMALGVFFGFLIPIAQIPFAATMAVVLRANLPTAVASTLVTNPVTFGPVYYGAYRLGKFVLHQSEPTPEELAALKSQTHRHDDHVQDLGWTQRIAHGLEQMGDIGKPLFLGLAIVACVAGFLTYMMVHWIWLVRVRIARWRRIQKMRHPDRPF